MHMEADQENTAYSVQALEQCTGIPAQELQAKARELSMLRQGEQGGHIMRIDLSRFFDAFFQGRHYSLTYRQPAWLSSSQVPWCKALNSAYEDPVSRPASVSPQQGEFLRSLVVNENPHIIVEIGTFLGVSTLWIGGALQDAGQGGKLYSMDLFQDILPLKNGTRTKCIIDPLSIVVQRIRDGGISECVTLVPGDSKQIGQNWNEVCGKPIDILYIDGDHSVPGCVGDFEAFYPHLAEGAIIVLHDIFPANCSCEGPRFLLDKLARVSGVQSFELETSPHNFGMAVLKIKAKAAPRA